MAAATAGVYVRVSQDRDAASLSPDRQRELCEQLCQGRGWAVVGTFEDRDQSAYGAGRSRRPGWNALRAAVRRGEVSVIVAASIDRLGRRLSDLVALTDFLEANDCKLAVVDSPVDTTTAQGRLFFHQLASFAEFSSALTADKIRTAVERNVRNGDMHGGQRQFGYRRGSCTTGCVGKCPHRKPVVIDPDEAKVVKELARRILKGETLYALAIELNDRGVLTAKGQKWDGQTVGQMMRSATLAGLRFHKGTTSKGNWKPILPEDMWRRVVAELDGRVNPNGKQVFAHLLTGLARCGTCGAKMKAASFRQGNGKIFDRYQCFPGPKALPCDRRVAASKESVDRVVVGHFLNFMAATELRPAEAPGEDLDAELADVQRRLDALLELHMDGDLDRDQFRKQNIPLRDRKDELVKAIDRRGTDEAVRAAALRPGNREDIEAWWEAASLEDRRQALAFAIDEIIIRPAAHKGGNKFDSKRVRIVWSNRVYERITAEGRGWTADPANLDHPAMPAATRKRFSSAR